MIEPAERATGLFHPRPRSMVVRDLVNRSRRRLEGLGDHPIEDAAGSFDLLASRQDLQRQQSQPGVKLSGQGADLGEATIEHDRAAGEGGQIRVSVPGREACQHGPEPEFLEAPEGRGVPGEGLGEFE